MFQFRQNFIILLPAIFLAYIQRKIWSKQPEYNPSDTEIAGSYHLNQRYVYFNLFLIYFTYLFLFIEFLFSIFPIINNVNIIKIIYLFAYLLIIFGFISSLLAIRHLASNWTGIFLYRIKKNQKLVTTGIYKYLRHPIYSAVLLELTGYQLLVNSYLSLVFLPLIFFFFLRQIQLEEKLLIKKYGQKYLNYCRKTKSILPFIY